MKISESRLRQIISEEIAAFQEREIVNVHSGHTETAHSKLVVNLIKGNQTLLDALKNIKSQQDLTAVIEAINDLTGVMDRPVMMSSLAKVTSHQKKG